MVDICTLPNRAIFRITGSDSHEWLQGLITNDLDSLNGGKGLYAGLLSPQGKILFDFLVYRDGQDFLVDCEASTQAALMKRLSMYKMRSDVTLSPEPDLGVLSSCTKLDTGLSFVHLAVQDPRLEKLGFRMIGDLEAMKAHCLAEGFTVDDETVYHNYLHKLGVPDGAADFMPDKAYPLESNFEELGGVSFTKGCFIGQEVVARMKHKTSLKKRVLPVRFEAEHLAAGADILDGTTKVGTVISSSSHQGLALVRLGEWSKAKSAAHSLMADGNEISVDVPDWLNLKEDA